MRFPKSHCDRRSVKVIVVEATTAWKHAYLRYMLCARRGGAIDRAAAATSGKSHISHAKRKVFGRKTAPPGPASRRPTTTTTFPFYKTTTMIRVYPSRVFSSLHGSRVIHHLRVVVLVITIIHRGVTSLKYYIPGIILSKNSDHFKNQ